LRASQESRPRGPQGQQQPRRGPDSHGQQDAAEHHPDDSWATCAKSDPDAHLSRPLTNGTRHDCTESERRQCQP